MFALFVGIHELPLHKILTADDERALDILALRNPMFDNVISLYHAGVNAMKRGIELYTEHLIELGLY